MSKKDKDERKSMLAISFIVLACSSAAQILPSSSVLYFVNNLSTLEFYPMLIAFLIILFSEVLQPKISHKPMTTFILGLITIVSLIFIPVDFTQLGTYIILILGIFALTLSSYLFIKGRKLSNILILLATASFIGYGLGWTYDQSLSFIFLSYTFGFIFIALAFSFVPTDDKSSVSSIFRISKQLDKTEKRLRDLELEYRTVFESVNDAIFVIDSETGLILDCNPEATKLLEFKKDQIVGNHQKTLFPLQNGEEFTPDFVEQAQKSSKLVELQVTNRKGEIKDVAVKLGTLEQGQRKLWVGVFRDISEQKKAAEDLSFALESIANKMDRIQTLNEKLRVVGGLTRHDVRNKLSVVTGNCYLIKKKHADQADIVDSVLNIEQSVKTTEKILDFAKAYEQLGVEELVQVNVEKEIDEAAKMFSSLTFKIDNNCKGLTVLADSFLRQLVYNLIDNTRKYGATTKVAKMHYEKTENDNLLLIYEDDGVGIPLENKLQLFRQGFSTGGSTGFGLFLIKKMIDVYGWEIEENGEPGKGAKFIITIPKLNKNREENYQICESSIQTIWAIGSLQVNEGTYKQTA